MPPNLHVQKQDTEHHRCNLPGEPWNIITKFIEGGIFVNFRRTLKRYIMINKNHPYTRAYAPSLYRLKQEEKKHLIENYTIIHPLSMFSLYFEMCICFILIIHFITGPIIYAVTASRHHQSYAFAPVNATIIVMIIVTFRIGVYDEKNNTVSMKPEEIAKSYLKSYFFLDLICIVPQILRVNIIGKHIPPIVMNYALPALLILKYIRYIWCLKTLKMARLYFGCSTFVFRALRLTLNLMLINVLAIYILFCFMPDKDAYDISRFLKQAEVAMKMLMLVGYGKSVRESNPIQGPILSISFLCIGFVFHLAVLVEVMSIWFKFCSAENKQTSVYESINAFTRYKALPLTLRDRIYLYLEFKYQGHFYKDSVLARATSSFLRREILLAATKNCLEKVPLFRKVPYPLMRKLRVNLSTEIFLPGDIIVRAGTRGRCMFFLIAGTVAVTTDKDQGICQLRDGSHFGEAGLINNMSRLVNVTAVTTCEVFKLSRTKFSAILKDVPELQKQMERSIAKKVSLELRTNNFRGAF